MLTLVEASKLKQNPLQAGVIETFASTSPVLERIPFMDVAGNAYSFNREQTLPGIAFRDYNEIYTESTGVVQQSTEVLKIFGGTARVDRALVKTQGNLNDLRAVQTNMKAKAAALDWTKNFFKGDITTNPKGFDGLEKRLTGAQVLDATAAGITLNDVDKLIDAVQGGPDVLFMNKTTRRTVNALRRAAGQATEVVSDAFGRQIDAYAGIPIGIIEDDASGNPILDFDETFDEIDDTTSIYAVRFGVSEWVSGLQCGGLEVIDQGLIDVWYQTLIEWICSFAIFHPKAAARLQGVADSGM
jgi:hypothetical protein